MLPADQDTATNPPSGQDQFFIGSVGDVDTSHLSLYSAHINNPSDWSKGATWTGDGNSQLIPDCQLYPGLQRRATAATCVPQKGISDKVDSLGDRLMYRFAYSNDSAGVQHWLVNFDVTASGESGRRALDGNHRASVGSLPQQPERFPARHLGSRWKLALDGFTHSRQVG